MENIKLNEAVNLRFNTLVNNIKNCSNSFYDSFLDLLEETIKYILTTNNILFDNTKTCGGIIKEKEVSSFLIDVLKIDQYTYDKLLDYIKKCNDHKHKKEKTLSIESVVNYLRVYYIFINYYYKFISVEEVIYNENYFISIFNEHKILNEKYKQEIKDLKLELDDAFSKKILSDEAYNQSKKLLAISELEKLSLEEQNKFLEYQVSCLNSIRDSLNLSVRLETIEKQNQLILENIGLTEKKEIKTSQQNLNNFFVSASKEYNWFGSNEEFSKLSKKIMITSIITILIGLVVTIFSTAHYHFYTTFSLFDNIWMIFVFITFIRNFKMTKEISCIKLSLITSYSSKYNKYYYDSLVKEKKYYKIFRILTYIFGIMNIILCFETRFSAFVVFFQILFMVSVFLNSWYKNELQNGYMFVKFTGYKINKDEKVSIIYDELLNQFYSMEEYKEKYRVL